MLTQEILNLITIIFLFFLLQFFRKKFRVINIECDMLDIAANDYTILVKNIPIKFKAIGDDYDDEIK